MDKSGRRRGCKHEDGWSKPHGQANLGTEKARVAAEFVPATLLQGQGGERRKKGEGVGLYFGWLPIGQRCKTWRPRLLLSYKLSRELLQIAHTNHQATTAYKLHLPQLP